MKQSKTFECACTDGYTGNFCEFKNQQKSLFFVSTKAREVNNWPIIEADVDVDWILWGQNIIGEQSGAYKSCSIMLNGEAVIFGGEQPNINIQVPY